MTPECAHRFSEPRVAEAKSGPLEGWWIVKICERCGVGAVQSVEDPDHSIEHIIGALEARGCDPRPNDDKGRAA